MKKPIHELLREWGDENIAPYCISAASKYFGEEDNMDNLFKLFYHIAEEIEKNYLLLPQYEDGEPVQFGEEFVDGGGNKHTLHEICFRDSVARGIGAPIVLKATNTHYGEHDNISMAVWPNNPVIRPAKLLDADDVEIKVGDTVYVGSKSYVVESINEKKNHILINNPFGQWWEHASNLTHREPDSLKKLRDDMSTRAAVEGGETEIILEQFTERLNNLIELDS